MNLEQFRILNRITLNELSVKTGIQVPTLSLYESGNTPIMLEDIFIIEKAIGTKLQWPENLTIKQKHDFLQSIITLAEKYPVVSVLNCANRVIKTDVEILNNYIDN